MIKNKHGWITRDFVVAGLLFSGIIAFLVLAIGGVEHEYPGSNITSPDFSENYDKLAETTETVEIMRNTTASSEGLDFKGTFDVVFGSTFTAIQLIFSTLGLYGSMSANIISDFPFLNSQVVVIFFILGFAILTTVLIFVWLSSIGRSKI